MAPPLGKWLYPKREQVAMWLISGGRATHQHQINYHHTFLIIHRKFRITAHKLMIENRRYLNIPREQRSCTTCNQIEDEIRVLDKWIKYKQLKKQKITNSKRQQSQISMFIFCFTKPSDLLCTGNMLDVLAKYMFLCNNCTV